MALCMEDDCRQQNHHEPDRVWGMRASEDVPRHEYDAAASRLGGIDGSWSRTATACSAEHPCYGCCLKALRALEAARAAASEVSGQ